MTATEGPAYRRVAEQLRDKIHSGELAAGARLPSLPDLGRKFGVSADVARQAIAVLRSDGLVETRQGSGAFIRSFARIVRSSPARLARSQWGAGRPIQDHDTGQRLRTADVTVDEVPAPDEVAAALGVAPGKPLVARSRRFLIDDRPVQLSTSYYVPELVRDTRIVFTDAGPGGSYARLAEAGLEPVRFRERVEARLPDAAERQGLSMSTASGRVLEVTRLAFIADGRCVEFNRMILDAEVYVLEYDFPA
ncbi:putative GntR-family transcriptional regulator [Actinoplanes missouriensis 431]|uniref:Putative GntR-family transcriptional regulator n=1 Tax=Actinoplanes missouriensis (strain ATCC 14538 / DSM 43046 / CBS 188.64 / JCM 3121 / NBRC 102363 / NCIMB 12654 / NRRL B-3342 / UNCC 431) TaxID=512565 RepID=I0HHX4_ACTM4|nr:GntR family transcriptional regulator [Actinoplanes missouriensis]BAL92611.1 putative GntR-family transcriptional regulator [Actinoplanes missouriensis 431]